MFFNRNRIIRLALACSTLMPAVVVTAAVPSADFPFEGNCRNRVNPEKSLTATREIIYDDGIIGRAIVLPGQAVTAGELPQITGFAVADGTRPFSVSFWFKPEKNGQYRIILSKAPSGKGRTWWIGYNPISRQADFLVRLADDRTQSQVFSQSVLPLAWNHLTACYDGRNIRLSVVPVMAPSHPAEPPVQPAAGPLNRTATPLILGGRAQDNASMFHGLVDELKFFDRALWPEEITRLFLEGKNHYLKLNNEEAVPTALPSFSTQIPVKNGQATAAVIVEAGKEVDGRLQLAGLNSRLRFKPEIYGGDFHLDFELAVPSGSLLDTTIAVGQDCFRLDGSTRMLSGTRGFPADRKGGVPLPETVMAGQPFRLSLDRHGEILSLSFNGKKVSEARYTSDTVGVVSVIPGKGVLDVIAISGRARFGMVPTPVTVFKSGDGSAYYRIPALLRAANGDLLAFAEARRDNCEDNGNIDMVVKRSSDCGKTWGSEQLIYEEGGKQKITCSNPVPLLDPESGRITLIFQVSGRWGDGTYKLLSVYSDDHGKTWSTPQSIKASAARPEWRACHPGPGHGLVIAHGPHRGRYVVPGWHAVTDAGKKGGLRFNSHVFYSDDRGKTWHSGGDICQGSDECLVTEIGNGILLAAVRPGPDMPESYHRLQSISRDGGLTWEPATRVRAFQAEICQGSILTVPASGNSPEKVLFSHPAGGNYTNFRTSRTGLTLRSSTDGGKTWPNAQLLVPGRSSYSDLELLPGGKVGCLFEGGQRNSHEGIYFLTADIP